MNKILLIFLFTASLLNAQAVVSTVAGSKESGLVNGNFTEAKFKGAFGICSDNKGNIYLAENGNNIIRKIVFNGKGNVTTFAGTPLPGHKDGIASAAQFMGPTGICTDNKGNFYIADFENHLIRKIDAKGNVTTVAGNGKPGYKNGKGIEAQFNSPRGICIDTKGNLYVGDSWNHRIRKIDTKGNVTTFAGGGNYFESDGTGRWADGPDTTARFYTLCGLAIDKKGNIYVADARNHRIRKVDPKGNVTTIAGTGEGGIDKGGFKDGDAALSILNTPTEVCVTNNGVVYFSDTYGNRIRKIENGIVSTVAGTGIAGFKDGEGSSAQFNFPRGLAASKNGKKIYVFDYNNNSLRLIEIK